jgi:hypothetical protein
MATGTAASDDSISDGQRLKFERLLEKDAAGRAARRVAASFF